MASSIRMTQTSQPAEVRFDPEESAGQYRVDDWPYTSISGLGCVFLLSIFFYLSSRNKYLWRLSNMGLETFLISHIIGFVNYGIWYIPRLSNATTQPLYTINFLWFRVHIAMSDQIVGLINRQPKNFSFHPFALKIMANLLGLPLSISKVLQHNLQGDGYMKAWHDLLKISLNPGVSLKHMLEYAVQELDSVVSYPPSTTISLKNWTENLVVRVGSSAFWGPDNPFATEPSLINTNNLFAENFHTILLYPFPQWTASKALKARERLFEAFHKYHIRGGINKASSVMKDRVQLNKDHGMSLEDCARLDVPIVEAVLANTVPLTLWMLYYILSDEVLCEEIRAELQLLMTENTMAWKYVRQRCPIFVSTWYEVLRVVVALPAVRTVLNDVTLQDRYFLQKDDHVIISPGVIHSSTSIWGSDVSFNPRRFIVEGVLTNGKGDLRSSVRAFGGGQHLCPGRFFSFHEIMITVATLILRFEIRPMDGREWKVPKMSIKKPSLGIQMPLNDTKVTITMRPDFEGKRIYYDLVDVLETTAF